MTTQVYFNPVESFNDSFTANGLFLHVATPRIYTLYCQLLRKVVTLTLFPLHRYTYRPDTRAVYGILTQVYQSKVLIGAVATNAKSKISLVGYDGEVVWGSGVNNVIEISMPFLTLDTELRWAWAFKFENVSPAPKK